MADTYSSSYTGLQVDNTVRDKVTTISQYDLNNLDPATTPTARIYIVTDGSNINTLWRSDGSAMVQISGSGGGSGGGTNVIPITQVASVPSSAARLAGLTISGTTFRVTHIVISGSTETMTVS